MGRGVSSGGGQSSLGYLFGSGEAPKPATNTAEAAPKPATSNAQAAPKPATSNAQAAPKEVQAAENQSASKPAAPVEPAEIIKQVPAGIHSTSSNNYMRADGPNTGNFITDRPSTKVHSAPGGGSSLGYLFGNGNGGGGGGAN